MNDVPMAMSVEEMDVLAWVNIKSQILKFERMLTSTRWFTYRFLHPVEATRLFVEAWEVEYRSAYASTFSTLRAPNIVITDWDHLMLNLGQRKFKAMFAAFWRGRQVADALGMPYDLYIRLALKERLRFWQRRHMPTPAMIYSEAIIDRMTVLWKERQEARLYLSDHVNYRTHRYIGTKDQNDHHEWLFAQAKLRSNPAYHLASFIREDYLPEEKVKARLGEDFERVQSHL